MRIYTEQNWVSHIWATDVWNVGSWWWIATFYGVCCFSKHEHFRVPKGGRSPDPRRSHPHCEHLQGAQVTKSRAPPLLVHLRRPGRGREARGLPATSQARSRGWAARRRRPAAPGGLAEYDDLRRSALGAPRARRDHHQELTGGTAQRHWGGRVLMQFCSACIISWRGRSGGQFF